MNTSYRVVELVRRKISNEHLTASDTDISRVLDVSRAAISAYKHERNTMSVDTLAKAQELLQLPEQQYYELILQLSAEGNASGDLQGFWQWVKRAVKENRVAGFALAVMVAAGTLFAPTGKLEAAALSSGLTDIHYANARKRRLRALARKFSSFLMPFPSHPPADALAF
jgi:transcriptional regulator with XRE-family HTH domain